MSRKEEKMLCPYVEEIKQHINDRDVEYLKKLAINPSDRDARDGLSQEAKDIIMTGDVYYFFWYDRTEGKERYHRAVQEAATRILRIRDL